MSSNYDILYNPLQAPHAGESSGVDFINLNRESVATGCTVSKFSLFLCVVDKKLKPGALARAVIPILIWAGQWLLEQMVAYLWSPVDDFKGFSSVALELLWLHQERPGAVSVWAESHGSAVQPPSFVQQDLQCTGMHPGAMLLHWEQSIVTTLPKYRILQQCWPWALWSDHGMAPWLSHDVFLHNQLVV